MDKNRLLIGYEIEFGNQLPRDMLSDRLGDVLERRVHLGGTSVRFEDGSLVFNEWTIGTDGSIRPGPGRHGYEIRSPIMELHDGLKNLVLVFEFINKNRGITNNSCGFHVNLSYPNKNKMRHIDKLKLLSLFDEQNVLKRYNRLDNRFCEQHKPKLLRISELQTIPNTEIGAAFLSSKIESDAKYRTINFGKLNSIENPYLEFRAIGGTDYHNRYSEIERDIHHFADCIIDSIDSDGKYIGFFNENKKANWFMSKFQDLKFMLMN